MNSVKKSNQEVGLKNKAKTILLSKTSVMNYLFRGRWRAMIFILLFELQLAYTIPPAILHDFSLLNYFVDALQYIAPIIGKIDLHNSSHPDAVRLYLALTLLLLIPKTTIFYHWLNKTEGGYFEQLVVSPLTDTHAGGAGDFIIEPLRKDDWVQVQDERSWTSRIFWSILIFAFTAGMLWANMDAGSPDSRSSEIRDVFRYIGSGGVVMWAQWSVKQMTFLAFLLAISITVGRDYFIFFKQLFSSSARGE